MKMPDTSISYASVISKTMYGGCQFECLIFQPYFSFQEYTNVSTLVKGKQCFSLNDYVSLQYYVTMWIS